MSVHFLATLLIPPSLLPQEVLRTLSFINTADEPSGQTRRINLSVQQVDGASASCSVTVEVVLVNDNTPVVDLSGPQDPSLDYSTTVTYALPPVRVTIASSMARLSDVDRDGSITTVEVSLTPGQQGDRILFQSVCPVTIMATTCSLR